MSAKKSLGQNFLMHPQIADRIAHVANITENDTVLEIGPGTGMLTKALLKRAKKVVAVELDSELVKKLRGLFKDELATGKLELNEGDIRSFDTTNIKGDYMLVANIPYYITGEIIRKFLDDKKPPRTIAILVQKELAERVARSKKESVLSVAVKTYGSPKYAFTVPRGAFFPAPNVDSAVLVISNIKNPFATDTDKKHFFDILHAGFAHKRKKLLKNLSLLSESDITEAFESTGVSRDSRAEDVSIESWKKLAENI